MSVVVEAAVDAVVMKIPTTAIMKKPINTTVRMSMMTVMVMMVVVRVMMTTIFADRSAAPPWMPRCGKGSSFQRGQ